MLTKYLTVLNSLFRLLQITEIQVTRHFRNRHDTSGTVTYGIIRVRRVRIKFCD